MTAIAVTIAGSDSGGGAGIQADLKTFSALGVYGASVLTALTAQNTLGVKAVHDVPEDFVRAQMDAVFADLQVNAVKIGMLSQSATIRTVASGLQAHAGLPIVLDPVMVAASGDPLIADEAISTLVEALVPMAKLITPNLHEAARLTGGNIAAGKRDMEIQAEQLMRTGPRAVLIKGGHGDGGTSDDFLLTERAGQWFSGPRLDTANTHGTGCTLSSAIAAGLAKGLDLESAVAQAKEYISAVIAAADTLSIGSGHGPVHHFHQFWSAS